MTSRTRSAVVASTIVGLAVLAVVAGVFRDNISTFIGLSSKKSTSTAVVRPSAEELAKSEALRDQLEAELKKDTSFVRISKARAANKITEQAAQLDYLRAFFDEKKLPAELRGTQQPSKTAAPDALTVPIANIAMQFKKYSTKEQAEVLTLLRDEGLVGEAKKQTGASSPVPDRPVIDNEALYPKGNTGHFLLHYTPGAQFDEVVLSNILGTLETSYTRLPTFGFSQPRDDTLCLFSKGPDNRIDYSTAIID